MCTLTKVTCDTCSGTGTNPFPDCEGSGRIYFFKIHYLDYSDQMTNGKNYCHCSNCNGTGIIRCSACSGSGTVNRYL